ncbi:AMP-binding protein [Rhizobium cauense]|uniref:AMP-binding protein n=1 Tax=Rhizobium cauense TaxID=1166683 RepID=UPI001C6E188A|nr:AMP-binding protein [Rhizobium cauense]MBW9116442.1 AMP-binding protein [Rhizobium cauense]
MTFSVAIRHLCLGEALDQAVLHWPDRIGWVFDEARVSFREMQRRSDALARALLAHGIKKGDTVAIWTPNLPEFAYCQFACAKVGAVIVAINTRFKTFELGHVLKHSQARILIMVERFLKHDFVSTLSDLAGDWVPEDSGRFQSANLPHLERVISLGSVQAEGFMAFKDFENSGEIVSQERLMQRQSEQHFDDPVILQYTSGTTALPKGALCSHRYALNFGVEFTLRTGLKPGEPFLNTQPFYHVGGSCGAIPLPLTLGGAVVSAEYYEVERILSLIERERCVSRSGYGAMYIMEMNHERFRDYDLSSLRGGWCVGTPALMERVRDAFDMPDLVQIYGATEGGGAGGDYRQSWDVRASTCGTAVTGSELAIFDPETNERLTADEIGEIRINGWWRMNGYLRQPLETAKAMDNEGWIHTGDLGALDAEGNLRFVGRLKDMLKIGGENVSAEEVEAVLLQNPHIKQVAVIGAPDDRLSEVVMAIVELKEGAELDEAEVIRFCSGTVANFRVPRYVRFTREWPLTGSGKIQKHLLREIFLEEFQSRKAG